MKDVLGGAAMILLGLGSIVAVSEVGHRLYQHYAPLNEQIRRETFEQSQAYNEGMLRDLDNLQLQYVKADGPAKDALRAVILERFASYDIGRLPGRLQTFYYSLHGDAK